MPTLNEMHRSLNNHLHALDKHQQDAHDARIVHANEYRRHHITPVTGKYAPHPTHSIEDHLIETSHVTTALAATINNPQSTESNHVTY